MPLDETEFHRDIAKRSFNKAWDILDKKQRSADDERQMLHLAHASRYHWDIAGTPSNQAVGDWQISRIYAALSQPSLSLLFAKSSLETCEKNNLQDILPSAYEGMARAYAISGDPKAAREQISKSRELLSKLTGLDEEDRRIFEGQIRETESLIR
jgi:hypothetical protein